MHKLERTEKKILKEIFSQSLATPKGIEAAAFRAHRQSALDLMDELERDGFLRREEGRYLVSLTALPQINHPLAKQALRAFEKIFTTLKDKYREFQSHPVRVDELARDVGFDEPTLRIWVNYMIEGSWWGGRSNDILTSPEASVTPSESILKTRRFRDIIKQLEDWQEERLTNRRKTIPVSQLRQMLPSASLDRHDINKELVGRSKPDWHELLPSEVRSLLDEVYLALANNMRALASMGLRSVIDMVCVNLVGDVGSFAEKLKALRAGGHVGDNEMAILGIAIDIGNASAHRGHHPSGDDINSLLDICEHLLKGVYVLPSVSRTLQKTTPPRVSKKAKTKGNESSS